MYAHPQVNTQAKQQAAEAEAAMAALLAPGSGLEGRLSQVGILAWLELHPSFQMASEHA